MCCRKDLARTGNPLISNIERIQPGRVFLE
ncbi:hypothetical protein F383_22880 [Gossypium arboreum]|uniref:Uncharacterized protein n=2 Tax=Gossypium arboreum TaxID=29729 RepID=A0A0B0P0H6_GOSAR|nr:hypothetical protein F383_22880 [Gossypium arboreum]